MLEMQQSGTPPLGLPTSQETTKLPQTAETLRAGKGKTTGWAPPGVRMDSAVYPASGKSPPKSNNGVGTAGLPYGLRGIPPASGRHPVKPADQISDWNRSHCLSPTASASCRKRSWLARSIRTSEGDLCQGNLTPRSSTHQTGTTPLGQDRACWGSKGTTPRRQLLPAREGRRQARYVPARLQVYHESPQGLCSR